MSPTLLAPIGGVPSASFPAQAACDRLVIVHPHQAFDISRQASVGINEILGGFSASRNNVRVLQGLAEKNKMLTDEPLPPYLDDINYPTVSSECGEIEDAALRDFIIQGAIVYLTGGIVDQCHRRAFHDIAAFIEAHRFYNKTKIRIPYDACYFQHNWAETGRGAEDKRFHGIAIGGTDMYEMTGRNSYTLRDVASRVFGEWTIYGDPNSNGWHRLQRRDTKGNPLRGSFDNMVRNLELNLLKWYFEPSGMDNGINLVRERYHLEFQENFLDVSILAPS